MQRRNIRFPGKEASWHQHLVGLRVLCSHSSGRWCRSRETSTRWHHQSANSTRYCWLKVLNYSGAPTVSCWRFWTWNGEMFLQLSEKSVNAIKTVFVGSKVTDGKAVSCFMANVQEQQQRRLDHRWSGTVTWQGCWFVSTAPKRLQPSPPHRPPHWPPHHICHWHLVSSNWRLELIPWSHLVNYNLSPSLTTTLNQRLQSMVHWQLWPCDWLEQQTRVHLQPVCGAAGFDVIKILKRSLN